MIKRYLQFIKENNGDDMLNLAFNELKSRYPNFEISMQDDSIFLMVKKERNKEEGLSIYYEDSEFFFREYDGYNDEYWDPIYDEIEFPIDTIEKLFKCVDMYLKEAGVDPHNTGNIGTYNWNEPNVEIGDVIKAWDGEGMVSVKVFDIEEETDASGITILNVYGYFDDDNDNDESFHITWNNDNNRWEING